MNREDVMSATDASDDELMIHLHDGDRDALGELYRRHRARVVAYLTRRVACEADAEDLVHETFLRAWANPGDYRPVLGYGVQSWLCGLAGQVLRRHAWNDRHPYLAARDAVREAFARPVTETAEQRESRPLSPRVLAALAQLNPAERRAIQLRYLDDLSGEDAAAVVGCTRSSIHTNTMTARRKLAVALAELARPARSPLVDLPRYMVVRVGLSTLGYDSPSPAVIAWLRERGVRVCKSTVCNVRRRRHQPFGAGQPGTHTGQAAA